MPTTFVENDGLGSHCNLGQWRLLPRFHACANSLQTKLSVNKNGEWTKSFYGDTNSGTDFLAVLSFMARLSITNIINNNKGRKAKAIKWWDAAGPWWNVQPVLQIRIQWGPWIWIRNLDPDPEGQMTHKTQKVNTLLLLGRPVTRPREKYTGRNFWSEIKKCSAVFFSNCWLWKLLIRIRTRIHWIRIRNTAFNWNILSCWSGLGAHCMVRYGTGT